MLWSLCATSHGHVGPEVLQEGPTDTAATLDPTPGHGQSLGPNQGRRAGGIAAEVIIDG